MHDDPNAYYTNDVAVSLYDLFTGGSAFDGDIPFYLECAARCPGPILELAVGTGRVAIPLARAGHEVVGLDLSPAMLKIAAAKCDADPEIAGRLTFIEGNMAGFDLGRRFALVLIAARSFQHLADPAAQRSCLDCVRRHLVDGGELVIDMFDPKFELLLAGTEAPALSRERRDPASGHMIRRSVIARETDFLRQVVSERLRFEVIDDAGKLVRAEETTWKLRWSGQQEMAYLLELCGFEPVALYSDFQKSPPAYGREQLWVARARS